MPLTEAQIRKWWTGAFIDQQATQLWPQPGERQAPVPILGPDKCELLYIGYFF